MPRELIQTISAAFETKRPPLNEPLTTSADDEAREETEPFRGKRWDELEHTLLEQHHYAMSWFTPRAFHYYLPAFLVCGLSNQKAVYVVNVLLFLKPSSDPVISKFREERWQTLSGAQIATLEAWLRWFVENGRPAVRAEFEDALDVVQRKHWWQ